MLTKVPGITLTPGVTMIAEILVKMSAFDTPGHQASLAVVCFGQHESASKFGSNKNRVGNTQLYRPFGMAAPSAIRIKRSFLHNRYRLDTTVTYSCLSMQRLTLRRYLVISVLYLKDTVF